MNPESDDPQLRQLFTEQRHADAQRAPAFAAVTARAGVAARASVRPAPWLRPAIAFVVVALMAAVFVMDRQPPEQLVASVLNWESPTDFLLETSATSPSELTSSIAEIVPQLPPETNPTGKETP